MPTVLRFDGYSVVIYPADHVPATCMCSAAEMKRSLICTVQPDRWLYERTMGSGVEPSPAFAGRSTAPCPRFAGNGEGFMVKLDEFVAATRRGAERRAKEPIAVAARYDRRRDRIVVSLNTGMSRLPAVAGGVWIEGLDGGATRRSGRKSAERGESRGVTRQRQTRGTTAESRGQVSATFPPTPPRHPPRSRTYRRPAPFPGAASHTTMRRAYAACRR